jgi:biopolymer transport protein ExbB/TolQ
VPVAKNTSQTLPIVADTSQGPAANRQGARLGALPLAVVLTGLTYGVTLWLHHPLLHRYLLGHPICVAEVAAFWLGVATLIGLWRGANHERRMHRDWPAEQFVPEDLSSQPPGELLAHWLDHLSDLPVRVQHGRLARRLTELLRRLQRHGEPHRMPDELREISERDGNAAFENMGLVRIIIWAVPMLGFLGTVVGITATLGKLDFGDAQQAMVQLKTGLYVAFDTTALAIVLAIALMFLQHPIDRRWQAVLATVDEASGSLLEAALPMLRTVPPDSPAHAVQEFALRLESAMQQLVERQATVWRQTIDAAHSHWEQLVCSATATVHEGLSEALEQALSTQAQQVIVVQQQAAEALDSRWRQWQSVLSDHARAMVAQQQALVRQSELLQTSSFHAERIADQQQQIAQQLRRVSGPGDLAAATRILAEAVAALHEQMIHRGAADGLPARGKAA